MNNRNKIGFHLGPGGNPTGIGHYMRRLDSAGIPFTIKSVDHYGPCFEAAQLARQSALPHSIIFRLSTIGQNHSYDFDVPPYKDIQFINDPAGAAAKHWQKTKAALPPEFDRSVWIEPINEVDKNLCNWLGHFGVHIANLAQADGYKVALFAWSSGEPEREGWQEPGMLEYLHLCAERPEQAAIALHEYSYEARDLFAEFPNRLGRFQLLFDVCDQNGIARPTTFITEWGWTLNEIPTKELALPEIKKAGDLYAPYPEIKGAAIWYLGSGWSGLANKVQKLIEPVTTFSLNTQFAVPSDNEVAPVEPGDGVGGKDGREKPDDDGMPGGTASGEPPPDDISSEHPDLTFVRDITIPDDTRLGSEEKFSKTWRVRNSGGTTWGPGYGLRFVGGEPMTARTRVDVPVTVPGAEADLTLELIAPPGPGVYSSNWSMVDPTGQPFGDNLFTRIISIEPFLSAEFIADVTVPDDTEIETGTAFIKSWRVRNNGTLPWGSDFTLHFTKGTPMAADRVVDLPTLAPSAEIDISLQLTAPFTRGTHFCDWRFKDAAGNFFGDTLFARIQVT